LNFVVLVKAMDMRLDLLEKHLSDLIDYVSHGKGALNKSSSSSSMGNQTT